MNTTKNVLFDPLCTARQCGFLSFVCWIPSLGSCKQNQLQHQNLHLNFSSMFHWKMYCLQKLKTRFLHFDHICPFFVGGESYLQLDGFCSQVHFGYIPILKNVSKILMLIIIIHPFCVWGLGVTLQQDLTLI